MTDFFTKLQQIAARIRGQKPLILNLTNYVTQDFMANSLLAIGAAPIMSESQQEITELVNIASAVNINIGTFDSDYIERVHTTVQSAHSARKVVVLDPVGCGATMQRTLLSRELVSKVNIVRGNASEIIALKDSTAKTLGVESTSTVENAYGIAIALAQQFGITVVVSGATDLITNSTNIAKLSYGTPLMQSVTGMGCVLTAIIAAFVAVENDYFMASKLAVAYFTLCAEMAAKRSVLPGSFKVAFLDMLYQPDWDFIKMRLEDENA